MTNGKSTTIEAALRIAQQTLVCRFNGAACAIVAGSIMRGEGTIGSDIDLVVIYRQLDAAWRESFIEAGVPVEAFVHDPATLGWFIKQDTDLGYPVMAHMMATGRAIGTDAAFAKTLQAAAAEMLTRGPPPLTGQRRDGFRYIITDLLEDLRGERSATETRAIAANLYQSLADLTLLGRGTWSGKGKWIPRLLHRLDPQLAESFDEAFRRAFDGHSEALVSLAEQELARHGGVLFAGDKREAPPDARLTTQISPEQRGQQQ